MYPINYNQNISLKQTTYANVYDVVLSLDYQTRYIGKLDISGEGTFTSNRSIKHLHRKTNSLGINLELLERFPFKWIVINFCGQKLITTRNYFLEYGRVFNFTKAGFEKQCFLPLELFGEAKAREYEETLAEQCEFVFEERNEE